MAYDIATENKGGSKFVELGVNVGYREALEHREGV